VSAPYGECEVCRDELSETEMWVYGSRCSGCVTEGFLYHRREGDWRPPDGGPYDPARYADSVSFTGPSAASIEQFVEAHTSDPGELLRDIQAARRRVAEMNEAREVQLSAAVLSPAQAEDLARWRWDESAWG
jgi:hypothetical protein